ncbi:hypothetical protein H6F86_20810 [Phormidium sp. FACHB-592]|uniref:Uncharacterized protein n=1 Tax=Stenomitos frigidus AS-A4 TaxID=2933935 RepID=A0ABV0KEQ1_9CYAN|nr:hypothetical protein [Phormidium sp. FACHB-592]MBD2076275.1 hypothetical protein [Phormidium sp. FACHB-592]
MEISPVLAQIARQSSVVYFCLSSAESGEITWDEAFNRAAEGLAQQYRGLKAGLLEKGYDVDAERAKASPVYKAIGPFDPDTIVNSDLSHEQKICALCYAVANTQDLFTFWLSIKSPAIDVSGMKAIESRYREEC